MWNSYCTLALFCTVPFGNHILSTFKYISIKAIKKTTLNIYNIVNAAFIIIGANKTL